VLTGVTAVVTSRADSNSSALQVSCLPSTDTHLLQTLTGQIDGKFIAADDIQKLMAEAKAAHELQRQQQEQKASDVKPAL
jgi:hypothetical protein